MNTFASAHIWGGVTANMPTVFPEMIERIYDFVHDEDDENTHIMCSTAFSHGHEVASCVMYHTESKVDPPSLQCFSTLQPQMEHYSTRRNATNLGFVDELSHFTPNGLREVLDHA